MSEKAGESMADKFLYQYVEPAHVLADRLNDLAYGDFSELGNSARDAAAMLLKQQEQLGKVLNMMLQDKSALDVVEFLLRAELTPSELLSEWQVPRNVLEAAQKRIVPRDVDF